MADYGFKAVNDNGEVQIDSTYRNFSKIFNGSMSLSASPAVETIGSFSEPPVIAWRPDTVAASMLYSLYKTGDNYTSMSFLSNYTAPRGDIDYAGFSNKNAIVPSDAYGLLVKNASGEVCFSSEEEYFKIVGIHNISNTWDYTNIGSQYIDITVSDATNNYFILTPINHVAYGAYLYSSPNYWWWIFYTLGLKKINSTTIRVEGLCYHQSVFTGSGTAGSEEDMQLLEISY